MSMPSRLSNYLLHSGVRYDVMSHAHSHSSLETARTAHVLPHQLAKSVILEDGEGCVMAVVPADARVQIGALSRLLGRNELHLSDEQRISELFADCDLGAVPAVGMAWGMETIVDESLEENAEIYIEAGDHDMVIRLSRDQFRDLMREARHARFCGAVAH